MSGTVSILPVEERHVQQIRAIEERCFPEEPWSEASLRLFLEPDRACAFVAEEEGTVLGYGGMLLAPDEGQVTNIAVLSEARRRGLGRALCKALMQEVEKRGLGQLSLEVRASNEAAIALYASLGFAVAGRRRGFYRRPAEDGLVMLWERPSDRT